MSKTFLSAVKPSGRPHIGNYFGAMKQCVDFQNNLEEGDKGLVMIADYHALNFIHNAEEMHSNIVDLLLDYLAIGLDPLKVILFQQSAVSEHTELTWIFDTITTMPYLMRAHAFKDAEAKDKEISVGTFNYPLLMASDILLYDTDIVPVGFDQKQHVEYARDTAQKFNHIFKTELFKLPSHKIVEEVAVVPGIDGQKMSKSYGNTIPLFATDEEIKKQVMAIVTDSGSEIPKNVYAIHALIRDKELLDALYEEHKGKYKALKEALIVDLIAFVSPLRQKRAELAADMPRVLEILKKGSEQAKKNAEKKMEEVRKVIGVRFDLGEF